MRTNGFTLIELLITLSLSSLLAFIGVPSLFDFVDNTRAESNMSVVYHTYQRARLNAVTSNRVIIFCGSEDGVTCNRNWSKNILAFADKNHNGNADDGELLEARTLLLGKATVKTKVSLGLPYIKINPDGSVRQMGSMVYCPAEYSDNVIRALTWNRVGRIYNNSDVDYDGNDDKYSSGLIDCSV